MSPATNVLLLSSFLLAQFTLSGSLQCYTCSGPLNTECGSLVHIPPKTCDQSVCATYILQHPGAEVLYRSCSPENICSVLAAQYENSPYDSVKECKVCDQDECNSASVAILSLGVVSVALLLHQVL
ncbi:unnamed protein product [Tenebrio molitor]|jgi:hypothetical protein|nr:unnamed protein product [Tenebrio molitor]